MAVAEAPVAIKRCKHNHDMVGSNVARLRTSKGYAYDACKRCRADAVARVRQRQRGQVVPLFAPTPTTKPAPDYRRERLWTQLRKPLRDRVIGIIQDDQPRDPLVNAVIRRAAMQQIYSKTGADFSAIALVEALCEASRTSTDSRMRIENLLVALLG